MLRSSRFWSLRIYRLHSYLWLNTVYQLLQFLFAMPLTRYHSFGHFWSLNRCAAASRLTRFLLTCCSSHFTCNIHSTVSTKFINISQATVTIMVFTPNFITQYTVYITALYRLGLKFCREKWAGLSKEEMAGWIRLPYLQPAPGPFSWHISCTTYRNLLLE